MASNTDNLQLYKKDPLTDGNDTFDIQTMLNDNWDKIDEELGAQVVASPAKTPVSLVSGQQVITSPRVAPYNVLSIKGLTRVNLLGRAGNCEDASKWSITAGSITLDATNKTTGNYGFKVTGGNGSNYGQYLTPVNFNPAKYYIILADVKAGNTSDISVRLFDGGSGVRTSRTAAVSDKFTTVFAKAAPNTMSGTVPVFCDIVVAGDATAYAYIDAFRAYEITAAEYSALDSMTPAQVAARYPYVDDVKPINTPYVIKYGENLLPTFYECSLTAGTGRMDILAPYKMQIVAPDGNSSFFDTPKIKLVVGQQYTISATVSAGAFIQVIDAQGIIASVTSSAANYTFTAREPDTTFVRFSESSAGITTHENPMLNPGTTALPFRPKEDDYLVFPAKLHSNIDRSVYDEITYRDGQYWKNSRFGELELDGSLPWTPNDKSTGLKQIKVPITNFIKFDINAKVTKYDGKILNNETDQPWQNSHPSDSFNIWSDGVLYLSIPGADSGWGDGYTPTQAEIQAYFNGWKMYTQGGNTWDPYNGTGTKAWVKVIYKDNNNAVDTTLTLPTDTYAEYKPYKLIYQLATPTTEVIPVEGGITLPEGLVQMEVGAGMVVRELAKDIYYLDANYPYINATTAGKLSYATNRIIDIYRGVRSDKMWKYITRAAGDANIAVAGTAFAQIPINGIDKNEAYTVTYLPRDLYLLTGPVQSIDGEYSGNLKTAVDTLAHSQADVLTRVSVLETQKAGKEQPQRILATLINAWVNDTANYAPAAYYKDSLGFVHLEGVIKSGTSTFSAFKLPPGYRPYKDMKFPVLANNGSDVMGAVIVWADGRVDIYASNNQVSLCNISFLAA